LPEDDVEDVIRMQNADQFAEKVGRSSDVNGGDAHRDRSLGEYVLESFQLLDGTSDCRAMTRTREPRCILVAFTVGTDEASIDGLEQFG
jgi:hypothetical protein